ncbi:ribosome assembly [Lithohypha guttulata]|uniref:Ribosome assembly n=1 Tax=Lithohypha guttulata TaxID=1690604 RepID=A0AAN7SVI5_9EURO|nr:ribosome assembly [Lithohypha guttulata]KAK5082739.1 ribosome assembly [Lithohypha guttulata]
MATIVPPPSKRQKIAATEKAEREAEEARIPEGLGPIRIQFIDQGTGKSAGPAVAIDVQQATVKNLENLLNTLQAKDASERTPYRFFFNQRPPDSGSDEASILDVDRDIYTSILKPGLKTTEDAIVLQYAPQAVFRVRPVSRCSASISGHGESILAATFSPATSSLLATGGGDNTARIWDCETGTPKNTLKGHTSWVLVVSFSPDGKILATGSMDNTVRLWDVKTGEALGGPLKGHTKWITSIAWEPYHLQQHGKPRLASASKDATVRIWDVPLRRVEETLSGHKGSITIYTSSQDKTIKVWNTKSWNCLHTLTAHAHWVNHLALSTDFVLRTGYHDHTKKVPETASTEAKVVAARSRFESAARIDGVITERLLSASDDNTIFLWQPSSFDPNSNSTPKPLARLLGHQKQVNHVSFSPDGHYIASASFDNSVKLWNAIDGKFITTLRGHVGAVYMCCWSADSRLLVSASKDTTLKVWDMRTQKLKEDLPGHKDEVFAVDWSADGAAVGSGGKDKTVKIWKN